MFTPHSCFYSCRVLDIHIVLTVLFCVHWFDENFLLCNYVFFFSWFLYDIVHFVENWYWCYLFSIWSGNVTLGEDKGQVVCVCVCVCVHAGVCVCVSPGVSRWAGDERRQSDGGREDAALSLFLSLSFLSVRVWIRMYRQTNWLIVFLMLETQSDLSAAS